MNTDIKIGHFKQHPETILSVQVSDFFNILLKIKSHDFVDDKMNQEAISYLIQDLQIQESTIVREKHIAPKKWELIDLLGTILFLSKLKSFIIFGTNYSTLSQAIITEIFGQHAKRAESETILRKKLLKYTIDVEEILYPNDNDNATN